MFMITIPCFVSLPKLLSLGTCAKSFPPNIGMFSEHLGSQKSGHFRMLGSLSKDFILAASLPSDYEHNERGRKYNQSCQFRLLKE